MKRKSILLPILVLLVCGFLTVLLTKFGRQVQPVKMEPYTPFVEANVVQLIPKKLMVKSQGTVVASTRIPLISELDGAVTEVSPAFREGGVFQKGEVLLRIDDTDYKAALAQARAQLANASIQMETVEAEARLAQEDWKEMESLQLGDPSPLLFREPQLAGARMGMASAEASLVKAEKDLKRTLVRAPFAGRVVSKMADAGQFVRRGQELARVFDVSRVEVKLPIPVSELAFLDPSLSSIQLTGSSDPVRVDLEAEYAGQKRQWTGYIHRTSGEIDPRSRMISLIAEVTDPYGVNATSTMAKSPLSVGMFVKADIHGRLLPKTFSLPRAALLEGGQVIVLDESDRITFRDVSIVRYEASDALIESGLNEGDRVCISRIEIPKEGSQVKPLEPMNEEQP